MSLETCQDLVYSFFLLRSTAMFTSEDGGHGEFLMNQQLVNIIVVSPGSAFVVPEWETALSTFFQGKTNP